jgi:hypothetical protein
MRLITKFTLLLSAAFILFFGASCTDTGTGPGTDVVLPPTITLNSGAGFISFNQELPLASPSFTVSISGNDGDAALRDLAILENGLTIPANRLVFTSGQISNNPIAIAGADQGGFNYTVQYPIR